ncbi:MAG: Glycerophosphoryl diester phosphodiesterase [Jatrophihabitans sp.]|nr:Glycerophosphoryl diester phosphodiesterase [Jatrophihabitans sp.]
MAHRGASYSVAEHTLAAYVEAIESGADGLECDVRMTRDGHLVCVHDRTVNRTSDGRGVVSDLDLEKLRALDFASWHPHLTGSADDLINDSPYLEGVVPDLHEDGQVLTLEQLLELVHDAGRSVRLLIETKHPTRYGGLVEKELVDLLTRFGWAGKPGPPASIKQPADMTSPIVVMSFAPTAIRRVKLLAPDVPTVLLFERLLPMIREGILPAGVPIAGPGVRVIQNDPDFVERAHARGHYVYVWTADEPDEVELVRAAGADAIITNRPREVIAQLDAV